MENEHQPLAKKLIKMNFSWEKKKKRKMEINYKSGEKMFFSGSIAATKDNELK